MALRLILGLDLLQFLEKLLLGEVALFDQKLNSGIYLDGIGKEELFEGHYLGWIKLLRHG